MPRRPSRPLGFMILALVAAHAPAFADDVDPAEFLKTYKAQVDAWKARAEPIILSTEIEFSDDVEGKPETLHVSKSRFEYRATDGREKFVRTGVRSDGTPYHEVYVFAPERKFCLSRARPEGPLVNWSIGEFFPADARRLDRFKGLTIAAFHGFIASPVTADLLASGRYEVRSVRKLPGTTNLEVRFGFDSDDPKKAKIDGMVVLDEGKGLIVREYDMVLTGAGLESPRRYAGRVFYNDAEDLADLHPIRAEYEDVSNLYVRRTTATIKDWKREPTPKAEFTLEHYGLEPPAGSP